MAATKNQDTSKLTLLFISSFLIGIIALIFVSMEITPLWANPIVIPGIAYGISILVSGIYQYSSCNTLNFKAIFLSNLFVLGTTFLSSIVLFVEGFPILLSIFGPYPPRNPCCGTPLTEGSPEYIEGMNNQNHYKIQLFSSIVKAVLPSYMSDPMKNGFVYLYWTFWMTMLPLFFLMSVQGLCK